MFQIGKNAVHQIKQNAAKSVIIEKQVSLNNYNIVKILRGLRLVMQCSILLNKKREKERIDVNLKIQSNSENSIKLNANSFN